MEKEQLTVSEAARLLGVSPATIRRMMDSGALHGWRIPIGTRHRRIPREEIQRLMQGTNETNGGHEPNGDSSKPRD